MNFEWYLALRYFKGNRKGSGFLSFIKYMAIAGVAIGSAGLLIALSIVHGFKSTIFNKVMGFAPHITVTTFTDSPIHRADTLYTHLEQYPQINSKQIVVMGQVMIQTKDAVSGTTLKGVDPAVTQTSIQEYITAGEYQLQEDSSGMPGIVMGASLARDIQAELGSVITVYTIDGVPSMLNSPELRQFRLTAIYETGIDKFDDVFALVDQKHARKLLGLTENQAHGIELKLWDQDNIEGFKEELKETVRFPYYLQTIFAIFGNIFAWVELQESMIPLVISGMIIVAAFNLIGTILMMVLERTRDIGILKTMGSRSGLIKKIFLLEGLLVSVVGLVIGIGISLLFNYLQLTYHIIPLSQENYYMSYAPVEPHGLDFIIVAVVTIVLCALASWIPARIASNTDPVKVISYGR